MERSPCEKSWNMSGSFSGGMPMPLSRTLMTTLLFFRAGGQPDSAPALGVLGGVGQQVHDDLLDSRRVGPDRQGIPLK